MKLNDGHAPALMNVGGLAAYLRVHCSTVYRLVKKGKLPAYKIGSYWRLDLEQIDRWRSAPEQSDQSH